MNGSGAWHAKQAWLGRPATDVLIEAEGGVIKSIVEGTECPPGVTQLPGWTIPGFANVHSHAFQHIIRGISEREGGNFWEWRRQMYSAAEGFDPPGYLKYSVRVFREMVEAGITAVGEFHYLHRYGNELGEALITAARQVGIRITLIDACYLRGGLDGRQLDDVQQTFSDGDAERWAMRMDELRDGAGVRIAAAIHSVRAVDPASMRTVAAWARRRGAPLHVHLAEQSAEVEECMAIEGCTPAELLEREGILGPDLTAIHAIHLSDHDISLLGGAKVSICACTTTERDLGDRVGRLRELCDAGCLVTVGSDSNAMIDMLEEARGLELDQRRATGRRLLHAPEELLRAATIDGMRALGWDAGELRPGMLADFVSIEPAHGLRRELDPASLLFGCPDCDHEVKVVVVGGKTVVSK